MKIIFVFLVMLVAMNASAQWQTDVRLTNDTAASIVSDFNNGRCITISGSIIHIVWCDLRDGNGEIYYKRSTDAGVSWGTDTRLSNGTLNSAKPSIAVSGSVVHVVWTDYRDGNTEIYYKRSTNAGVSWGAEIRMTNNTAMSMYPAIAVSGSAVHLVWGDSRDANKFTIYYKRSIDAGVTWGTDTRLNYDTSYSYDPSIAVSGSIVHLVFSSTRLYPSPWSIGETFYKRSTDGGVSWGADTCISAIDSWRSSNPSIVVSGSYLHVAIYDDRGSLNNMYYKRSTNGGVSWGTDVELTYNIGGVPFFSNIAASGSVVYVVYELENANYKRKVYYNQSTDAGVSWGASMQLTTLDTAENYSPFIEISGTAVHVIWTDRRNGKGEIYYKCNPTGNIGIQNISTEIPSAYSLSQNYPNPFNPVTNIKFSIVNSVVVNLVVYDIMGREVQTLVNERLQPGTYEATFDGSNLSSGIYFYKLTVGDFTETKRLTLIK